MELIAVHIAVGSAVLVYRSKFLDCLRGAVANSYLNVDLRWDNVIAGPWGWPRSTVLAKSRPVAYPSAGRALYRMHEPMIPVNELSPSGGGQFDCGEMGESVEPKCERPEAVA